MSRNWPILFIVIPLLELYLIIEVGSRIGALWTVLLVLGTAVVGVNLLRMQGLSTLNRARHTMDRGSLPAQEMIEGMALAVGGALLITPGFITDTLGFLCLIPASRRAIIRYVMKHSNIHMHSVHPGQAPQTDRDESKGRIIEGEFERKDP